MKTYMLFFNALAEFLFFVAFVFVAIYLIRDAKPIPEMDTKDAALFLVFISCLFRRRN